MNVHDRKRGRRGRSAFLRIGFGALILLAMAFSFTQRPATGFAQTISSGAQTIEKLSIVGTSTIHGTALGSGAVEQPEIASLDQVDMSLKSGVSGALARHTNLAIPSKEGARHGHQADETSAPKSAFPPPEPVVESDTIVPEQASGFQGFSGLSHIDQRTANSGNQFSIEPPDQGLCAGNGYVVETVNDVIRVFDREGNALTGVEDMNTFFGLAAAIDRTQTPPIRGPFLSDPRCYFDRQTQRWFVSELMEDSGGNTGATGRNFNLIAVSQTSHPTGAFTVFQYDVTDDGLEGTPNHPNCPCFGDQPLIGADTFGFYQTTNEFDNAGANFNGAQVYAISKAGLVAAADSTTAALPVVVHIDASQQFVQAGVPHSGLSYTLQPATSQQGQNDEGDQNAGASNGVEYFLSALQFVDTFDNRIAVWAVTNTKSLNSHSPNLHLLFDVVSSETYGQPNPAVQKAGEIPLGASLGDTEELLNTNDDRMNQVVLVNGTLYGAVNSLLRVGHADHQGIAWFAVQPSLKGSKLKGSVVVQGYVAVADEDVFFPSIALNSEGNGVIAFSLSGADRFPSAAYVTMDQDGASEFVHIAAAGKDPEDGFSGYPQFFPPPPPPPPNIARWGDYSAAVADGDRLWFAAEYIPKACSGLTLPCRTVNANWGTFLSTLRP